MNKFLPVITAICIPLALMAQDSTDSTQTDATQTARDRSVIVGFLEDNLSGAGRDIRIEGFKGLLSSNATLDELTIADDTGVWFTLRDVELDWSRAALFSGRVEINRIAAGEILFDRLPVAEATTTAPSPEAKPFSLPDLPVSIDIGAIEAKRVHLGAPVLKLGEAVDLSLAGSANLADGSGAATLDIQRLDAADGAFTVDVSFDGPTEVLDLDLALTEGAGGLIATLANLPGAPELSLTAKGAGPLDDFTADIALATQGKDRLTGTVALKANPDPNAPDAPAPRAFTADLSGDLTPLFSAEYARFFGPSSTLQARGLSYPEGGFDLEQFNLSTQAVSMVGAAKIGADGLPQSFALSGSLKSPDGRPTLLPFGSARSMVDKALIIANYDAATDDGWTALIDVDGYTQDGLSLGKAAINAGGTIARLTDDSGLTTLGAVSAKIEATVTDLVSDDPALQDAIGANPSLLTQLTWQEGQDILFETFELKTDATTVAVKGRLAGLDSGFEFTGDMRLDTPRLARFARISGLDLAGAVQATGSGSYAPLSGKFDLSAEAKGTNLRFGIAQVDALTNGSSTVSLSAKRDETGLTLRAADLSTGAVTASAKGTLSSEAGALTLSARLDDVARLGVGLSGPLTLAADVSRSSATAPWQTEANMTGPGGSTARVTGTLAQDASQANLALTGTAPLGLSNRFTTAALTQGNAGFDLSLNGPLALSSLSGQIQVTPGARVVVSNAGLALTVERGTVTLSGERAQIDVVTNADSGGGISASGQLGLSGTVPADLTMAFNGLTLVDPTLYSTSLNGSLAITGPLAGGAAIAGDLTLGRTDITVSASGLGGSGDIPEITHTGQTSAVLTTRKRAGLVVTDRNGGPGASYGLNVTIAAPNQIFIRGRGLDAELGGKLRLRGTTQDVIPVGQFSLIRGRLSLLGKRIVMKEGTLTLQGELDPVVRLVAETQTPDLNVQLVTEGPLSALALTLSSSPTLPQEEILSQLLFGRGLSQISALQAAQMASAVATLTGGGGGLVGSIRNSFGLDDLDLQTSEEGGSSLKLGKYISDKIYTDVTIDSDGKSVINLNLDATDKVTVKGSVSSTGDTGVGVYFEKDY